MTKSQRKLWIGLLIMTLLTPLGILLPEIFPAGDAWGEWGTDALAKLIGYVPQELMRLAGLWKAPIPDYDLGGEHVFSLRAISYMISGFLGMLAVGLAMYLIQKLMGKNE
ncbi:MAG: cobalamin biosynthesis protein [Deltaproteobacteria bacterium]|nr:cobalamin biosynthesis protein [Deltaproteobacteria bacterium]